MATLKDIANAAGISQGAVSRILNNDRSLNVAQSTRERVLAIAEEMGYKSVAQRHGTAGESVLNGKEINIGIAQMFEFEQLKDDIYYMLMKSAVDESAFSRRWNTEPLYRNETGNFVINSSHELDGIIAIGRFTESEVKDFERYTANIVFIDSSPDDMKYYSVTPNYHMAVRIVLNHFWENNIKEVAFVGAVHTFDNYKHKNMDPRFYYYRNWLSTRECYDENLLIDCDKNNSACSYESVNEYYDKYGSLPKAMFLSSDAVAAGVLKAIHEKGLKVPEDISMVTYNNTTLSESSNPPLDSIEVYMSEYAESAMESMKRMWEGKSIPHRIMIPCSLVERGSVKRSDIE